MHVARSGAQAQHRRLSGLQAVLRRRCVPACSDHRSHWERISGLHACCFTLLTGPNWRRSRLVRVRRCMHHVATQLGKLRCACGSAIQSTGQVPIPKPIYGKRCCACQARKHTWPHADPMREYGRCVNVVVRRMRP